MSAEINKTEGSGEGHTENLNFFTLPSVNTGILESHMIEYKPITQVVPGGPVHFEVNAPTFVDLQNSRLRLKVKLDRNGLDMGLVDLTFSPGKDESFNEDSECGPVNALFYSLFNQVDFSLSGLNTTTSLTNNGYAYKNYLDLLTSKPRRSNKAVLFIPDDPEAPEGRSPYQYRSSPEYGPNGALADRQRYLNGSKSFTMEGPLGLDMFEQKRLLLHNTPMSLKFFPNNPAFYLMSPHQDKRFRAVILDATLILNQVSVNAAVVAGVDATLRAGEQALYPIDKSIFKTFTIARGSSNETFDNVFAEGCPDWVTIAMVTSSGFSGSFHDNPYNFQHFSCNNISLSYNGVSVPGRPLCPDFSTTVETSDFVEAYSRLLKKNPDMDISEEQFLSGCTLFHFDLANRTDPDIIPISKNGSCRLEISFKNALDTSINVLLYAKKTATVKIDRPRNIEIK